MCNVSFGRFSVVYVLPFSVLSMYSMYIVTCLQLGDPSNKAASNADYLLLKLLGDHPNMKVSC